MGIGGAIKRALGGSSWIEKVKVEELEKEQLKLEHQIEMLGKEIEKLEARKKELFQQGIGKSDVEKMLLAEKIRDMDTEVKMKLKEYNRLMKQRRALSNLIRLKKWENRLREKGIWEKIRNVEPEKLMQMLTEVQFDERQFDANIEKINEILGREAATLEVESETREILELWEKVEKAELTPEAVEEKLKVKIEQGQHEEDREKETL